MLHADPYASEQLSVRLKPGADDGAVTQALGPPGVPASTAVGKGVPLVNTLRAILTAVAIVDGLVCLYALMQACTLTVQERRRTLAVIRACGAGSAAVRHLLAGAVMALVIPAAVLGILVETLVLGPALSSLAASYATLPLQPTTVDIVVVLVGLAVAGGIAVAWVARQATSESVVHGLAA
jgi:ABC-type antimicrobial peptide transport system permease subunit